MGPLYSLQICPSGEATDWPGREKPLYPFPIQDRRCHGHEHDLKGQSDSL